MKKLTIFTILITLFCSAFSTILAQDPDAYKKHPGFINFGDLSEFKDKEKTVEVFIKGPLLKFVSMATNEEDPELSKLIDNLLLIKIDVFSIDTKKTKDIKQIINKVSKKLNSKKWERMIRVNEPGEQVEIFTRFNKDNSLSGLVVMAIDERDEAVFVNIVGKIDPRQIGKLSSKFNIPKLDSLKINHKARE